MKPGPNLKGTSGSHSKGHSSLSLVPPGLPPCPTPGCWARGCWAPGPGSSRRSRGGRWQGCIRNRSQGPGGVPLIWEQHIPSPQLNFQTQAISERGEEGKGHVSVQGRRAQDGVRRPPTPLQEKSASHRQADEDVHRQLQLFRESPGGQFGCRYDSAESLTCEVKVLVLEALVSGAAKKGALWRRK